jgi:hypothetical protein
VGHLVLEMAQAPAVTLPFLTERDNVLNTNTCVSLPLDAVFKKQVDNLSLVIGLLFSLDSLAFRS